MSIYEAEDMDNPIIPNLPFFDVLFPQREASVELSGGLIQ